MTTLYSKSINELKNKLSNKNIKFNDIFNLISNEKYDKIIEIVDDDEINSLINTIITEIERIGHSLENKLNNLLWLNERLIQFGEEPQSSTTKARAILRTIYINIFDLESGFYEKKTTFEKLRKDLRKKCRCFPLNIAKKNITLKCFLQRM